ncbi:hypothetical protein Y1Q_0001984 [Alligator mississippiensis]|uniref:KAP NTPase domain-containing protein n=1 Tax=Alligator mississippiensis TaxID=8496 RepID=A0A151P4B0_ALLMI|nr:hypothetical protein Y1Q_0001984 [Alligator mississippiensis]
MNRTNMSDQLGFMHCVKTEVEVLTNFLQFKSFSQQRDIRVVLLINDLDICTSDRVVGVLDAVNILLSDKEVPFISILAVDPQIMVECIEKSSNMFNNGYEYLDRIISLPFSVPRMNTRTKLQILREYVHGKDEKEKQHDAEMKSNVAENLSCCPSYRRGPNHIGENPENAGDGENHVADLKIKVFNNLKTIHDGETSLPGNKIQLMRILNTITIELLVREKADKNMQQKQQNDAVRDWVLLTISWPCRLSWVLQCVEDKIQSIELKLEEGNMKETKEMGEAKQERLEYLEQSLLQVFRDNEGVLDTIKKRIKNLLELDGDPDVFKAFLLKCDFKVKDIEALANIVSLDHSLKRKLELIRGLRKKGSLDCTISIPNEDGNASL